jgi:UDP-N-acetylmuramoylalanine--D-glutamate ligase
MELGYRFCKGNIIAITGTNGKSTVTSLTGAMLKQGGKDTVVCGNIGNSLCGEIRSIKENTWVVLEVSSFQLEWTEQFKPRISVILNIKDDHMDRYAKFEDYFNDKLKIFRNQDADDFLVLNKDAKELNGLAARTSSRVLYFSRREKTNGAYVEGRRILCSARGAAEEVCRLDDLKLKGVHNIENVLAASVMARLAGVDAGSIHAAICGFRGLAHRFEIVDSINGVDYIDDSKGTTVDSTCRALESCEKPVILIAGGKDKHSNYCAIKELVEKKVKKVILIGEAAPAIKRSLNGAADISEAKDMDQAVKMASSFAGKDYIVLLSPMCSSFDMYSSYKERGEVFKSAVKRLKSNGKQANGNGKK